MYAAVLHTIGTAPRYEEFPEPAVSDEDDEAIVHVHAASLKPVDKQLASGSHYASRRELPCVCGSDGVGHLDDGQRVFFGGPRPPYGAMAQRTVVARALTFPVPESLDDESAAALPNPGVSAWLSLDYRAKLVRGENVLILGATGVTGTTGNAYDFTGREGDPTGLKYYRARYYQPTQTFMRMCVAPVSVPLATNAPNTLHA